MAVVALRRVVLILGATATVVGAAIACSSFDSVEPEPGDASPEAAARTDGEAESAADSSVDSPSPSHCAASAIALGYEHGCAILRGGGQVACWGSNFFHQAGSDDAGTVRKTAGLVPVLDRAVQLALGVDFSCALRDDHTVWCWGASANGRLGTGSSESVYRATPVQVYQLDNVVSITAGYYHSCARKNDSSIWCWGYNNNGQIGNGTRLDQLQPVKVISEGASVSAGGLHSCALEVEGVVECWGDNFFGEIGTPDDAGADASAPAYAHPTPAPVASLPDASGISAGYLGSCARFDAPPELRCWGYNVTGQLVPSAPQLVTAPPQPLMVPFPFDGGALSLGGYHSCALSDDHSVWCWGANNVGQMGTTGGGGPSRLLELGSVDAVSAGFANSCALRDGGVSCMGSNTSGQLGQGNVDLPDAGPGLVHPTALNVVLPPCP